MFFPLNYGDREHGYLIILFVTSAETGPSKSGRKSSRARSPTVTSPAAVAFTATATAEVNDEIADCTLDIGAQVFGANCTMSLVFTMWCTIQGTAHKKDQHFTVEYGDTYYIGLM